MLKYLVCLAVILSGCITEPRIVEKDVNDLIVNGDFATGDLTGWSYNFLDSFAVNASDQVVGTAHPPFIVGLGQDFGAVLGNCYRITYEVISSNLDDLFLLSHSAFETTELSQNIGTHSIVLVAINSDPDIRDLTFEIPRENTDETTIVLDNISVFLVVPAEIPTGGHQALERVYNKTRMKSENSIIHRIFQSAGVPGGSNMLVGDLCWDYTNEDAYICTVDGTTVVKMNA